MPDPNSVAEQAPYVGILSTLGVMTWGAIVAPDKLGVSQRAVLVLYGALALTWIVASRRELRRSDPVLLLTSAARASPSLSWSTSYEERVVEDFFKYVGIAAFAAWAFAEARASLVTVARQS